MDADYGPLNPLTRDKVNIKQINFELGMEGRRRNWVDDELGIDTDRESGDAKVSPAVDALNEIFYVGRQLRMHGFLVAESATFRALGGPEAHEEFATCIRVRYRVNAWRRSPPSATAAPRSSSAAPVARHRFCSAPRPARQWATTGKTAIDPRSATVPPQPGPVQLQNQPVSDAQPAAAPADFLTDPWSTTEATAAAPTAISRGRVNDLRTFTVSLDRVVIPPEGGPGAPALQRSTV